MIRNLQRWCAAHPYRTFVMLSVCSVLLVYRNVFSAAFVYDDIDKIPVNKALLSWGSLLSHYIERGVPFSSDYLSGPAGSLYRPLFWLSLALDRLLFGPAPFGFHLENLILHWANGLFGFMLLRRLRVPSQRAAMIMIVWLTLPINCEAVAWISARVYCLSTFFILLSLLFAEQYFSSESSAALLGYWVGSVLSLLSYEGGLLVLPLALLVAFAKRTLISRSCVLLCAIGGSTDIAYLLLRRTLGVSSPGHALTLLPVGATVWKYIQWILLPIHMSVERSSDTPATNSLASASVAFCCLLLFFALAFHLRHKHPEFAGGVAWMAIALLPYSGIVFIYQGMAERYAYLASMGAALAIVGLVWQTQGRKRLLVMGCFAGWFVWGTWRLNSRVLDWHDDISLYSSSLEADPNSPILLYNLANAVEDAGDLRTGFLLTKRALDLRPNYERALNGIGMIYLRLGLLQKGKAAFERASALDPNDEKPISNLGTVYMRLGFLDPAKVRLERAITLDPDDVQALSNLGVVNMRLGELQAAEKNFKKVIAIAPNENIARCNLAMVIFSQGRWDDAVEQLLNAARLHPSDANPYYFLGLLDQQMGAHDAAVEMLKRAVQLKPDYVEAQAKLIELEHRK